MDWKRLFDFRGHATRQEYWIVTIGLNVVSAGLTFVSRLSDLFIQAVPVLILALLYPQTAVMVRRLHDRGKSGWWALLFMGGAVLGAVLFPMLGLAGGSTAGVLVFGLVFLGIVGWAFVELGVLPGKRKGNRYVQDPEKTAAAFD